MVECICSESATTKHAFVTFKESQGANTAVLLTVSSLLTSFIYYYGHLTMF